jgi:hypothetical protein
MTKSTRMFIIGVGLGVILVYAYNSYVTPVSGPKQA